MVEKAIVALQLLGHLVETGLPFQFKGGTSLLLRLNPIRRLSIDVDIVTQASPGELIPALERTAALRPFIRYEHDERRDRDLPPKSHFKFFYPSTVEPKTDHVLLDVLFDSEVMPHSQRVLIRSPFIQPERDVHVSVPTVDSLLGDKLTAFAPKTIGILYDPDRRTDIVKQLFDIGVLFDEATDLKVAAEVYSTMHTKQLRYRNVSYSLDDTLNDTIEAGRQLSQIDLRGAEETDEGRFLLLGVQGLQNHLLKDQFRIDEARIAAGKAAVAAGCIQSGLAGISIGELRYAVEMADNLRNLNIETPWEALTRLKKSNPEAFHYWYQAQRVRRQGEKGPNRRTKAPGA
ncbi:nucleotidyl transferase AbiEii/AbiGii toxin family protein [Candidatus Sumerlaeota bacterium]|nr:nucleotidyl transferase AbiEii/AbiGii toxin family protein [Candidatus Sumerlaeota bacterium]